MGAYESPAPLNVDDLLAQADMISFATA